MNGFDENMIIYKEMGNHIQPSLERVYDIKSMTNSKTKTKIGRRIACFQGLAAVLVFALLPVCGYAAYKYPAIFTQFFAEEDAQMMEEMIIEADQMVENEDYRLALEQTLVDGNTRKLLVSVQAKNEESWKQLCEEKYSPGLSTYFAGGITEYAQEDMTNETEWKKYWTYELTARTMISLDMYFIPVADYEEASDIHYEIRNGHSKPREDYLCMEVNVKGMESEKTTVKIATDNLKLCEEIEIEMVYIDRLGIELVGHCEKNVLWNPEEECRLPLCEIKKNVGMINPEVIVEMEDGTKICVLSEESRILSMKVDEKKEITLDSRNNGLIYQEGSWSDVIVTGLEYKFTEVLDTNRIVKIWINGVEQEFENK